MYRRIFLLLFTYFVVNQTSWAQIRELPTNPQDFPTGFTAFYADAKGENSQAILKSFLDLWQGYTVEEQNRIMSTANEMLKMKMRPGNEFDAYLSAIVAYKASNLTTDKFENFHRALLEIMQKNRKDFKDLTSLATLLYSKNALYDNGNKTWKVSSQDYKFIYIKELTVTFPATDIVLYTKGDTMGVYKTKGVFNVNTNRWKGENGEVYWTRVGLAREAATGRLRKYVLDIRGQEMSADSIDFIFPKAFKQPVMGRFQDKATSSYQGERSNYPRFTSYKNVFKVTNVFKNIDYQGGFTLEGNQIIGTGSDSARAMITVRNGNKITFRAYSKSFLIDPEKIAASKASISIYLGNDSIYHSQCILSFQEKTRKLSLARKEEGLYASPFADNYHQFDFTADNLFWNIDEKELQIKSISSSAKEVKFESTNFYDPDKMLQEQKILDYNPITRLRKFFETYKKPSAPIDAVANYFSSSPQYIDELLFMLARDGFIFFDNESKVVTEKYKLKHYDDCTNKNKDYDAIGFTSLIGGKPNGSLNLVSNELEMQGVAVIKISDSQNTFILPKDQIVKLRKNRDMVFDGQVHSGRFDFWGKGFYFSYDSFEVVMNNVDSLKFKFPEYDKDGKVIAMREIQNTIQNVTGFLFIDNPDNRSGRKPLEKFPWFDCTKTSFVYYDKKVIYNGVYDKTRFFFKVDPFKIEKLDNFTAKGLKFPGNFTSANIIPEIPEALSIQEDFSLGFINESPPKGYPMYLARGANKGTGTGTFFLSNKGFRADAKVDYLVSSSIAKNFILFPDSMNSITNKFEIPNGTKYPAMTGKDVYSHWKPYADSMYIKKRQDPIVVYNGKVNFEGSFILTPVELVGDGVTKYQSIVLQSKTFAFLSDRVKTKSGNLELKSDVSDKSALSATDVKADLDLTKDFATFKTNSDTSKVKLPSNLFSTTLNSFTYDVKKKEVAFERSAAQKVDDAYFVSDNPDQENLQFTSSKATYSLNDLNLKAQDVPYLLIADSKITTPNKELTIQKNGVIGSIKGAEIITSETNQYHKIYNGLVNIFSKSKFTGYGNYDYYDKDKKKFVLLLSDIHTVDGKTTEAKGTIKDTAHFFVTPKIQYQGEVTLYSTEKNLYFNGYVKPEHDFKILATEWVNITDTVDPAEVSFEINNPIGQDKKELYCGTFLGADTAMTYTVFFGKKLNPKDKQIFNAKGLFYYDEKRQEFIVGDKGKIKPADGEDPNFVGGNYATLNFIRQNMYEEGVFDFGTKFKTLQLSSAGSFSYDPKDNKGIYDLAMILDFPFHDDPTKYMTDNLLAASYTAPEIKLSGKSTYNAFAMMIKDKKDRNKVINELTSYGYLGSADAINKIFVITKVQMAYNDSIGAFISTGKIGLSGIKKTAINKSLEGVIKIKSEKAGDEFGFMLSTPPDNYQYFDFQENDLFYMGSDMTWVDKITATAGKVSKGGFKLKQATMEEVDRLRNRAE